MNYKTFMETLKTALQKQLGNHVEITTSETVKNNGMVLHALILQGDSINLAPCIYVDDFFEAYQNGETTLDDIMQNIVNFYQQHMPTHNFDTGIVFDYKRACPHIRGRLINTEKNTDLLATIPHREFLDLSLIYIIDTSKTESLIQGSIRISNQCLEMWGITEEELYEQSRKNMELFEEGILENLGDMLCDFMPENAIENTATQFMYILTNKSRYHGAVQMLNTELLKSVSEIFRSDVIMLPSSIHELLLLPICKETEDVTSLAEIVENVNDTHLEPQEILSYHVYRYDRKTGAIHIVG